MSHQGIWNYEELIKWFCGACFDITPAAYAAGLLLRRIKTSLRVADYHLLAIGRADAVEAIAA